MYDCLRANKSLAAWGIEGRVPFLDKEFMDVAMTAEPQACFGNKMRQGVTNKNVVYDAKVNSKITDLGLVLLPPSKELALHLSQWVEQWNKEIGR